MSTSILAPYNDQLFYKVRLRIKFRDRILGGIPKGGKPLDYFMDAKHMSDAEKEDFKKRISDGLISEDEKTAIKEMSWCQFERDRAGNLCLWHGNIKAMMREIFVTFGLTQRRPNMKKVGIKKAKGAEEGEPLVPEKGPSSGGRQTLQHGVHVDPVRIPFERVIDDKRTFIKVKDSVADVPGEYAEKVEFIDKVKHIKDMSGVRSALGRHDVIDQPEMTIYLKWPADGVFTEDDMKKAWSACEDDGLGACRSQGYGKFDVLEWEVINDPYAKK